MISNARGISIIETLIAFGILSAAILGTGAGLRALKEAHDKTRVVDMAIEVEASLLRSMTQASTYADPVNALAVDEMRAGVPVTEPLSFDLCPDRASGSCVPDFYVQAGTTICFQNLIDNPDPGACDFSEQSADRLEVTVTNVILDASGGTNRYSVDYSIRGNSSYGKVAMMGNDTIGTGPAPPSYSVQIPVEAYQGLQNTDCQPIANHDIVVGINGYDKRTTPYTVRCIRLANAEPLACSPQTFPKSLSAVPIGGASQDLKLRMNCGTTARTLNCPAGYALQGFDPESMDPATPAPIGTCIYRGLGSMSGGTYTDTNGLIQGRVCPPNYRVAAGTTCTIISGPVAVPGTCQNWVPSCTGCNFMVSPTIDTCTHTQINTAQPPTGTATAQLILPPANPDTAICRLNTDPQACGARWAATIQLSVQCELAVPVTRAAF
jgi:hypothetical protein